MASTNFNLLVFMGVVPFLTIKKPAKADLVFCLVFLVAKEGPGVMDG